MCNARAVAQTLPSLSTNCAEVRDTCLPADTIWAWTQNPAIGTGRSSSTVSRTSCMWGTSCSTALAMSPDGGPA